MNLLQRYIFGQFTRNFLLVVSSLIAIYLLVDFFEKMDNFHEAGKDTALALQYLLLKVPLIIQQLLPVCLLLAAILTLGILNHRRELLALMAGGLSLRQIVNPILAATIIFSLLTLAADEWVLPNLTETTNRIWYEEVKKSRAQGIVRQGRIFFKGREGVYTFRQPQPGKFIFSDFNYTVWNENYDLERVITAQKATWHGQNWVLEDGLNKFLDGNSFKNQFFTNMELALPDSPSEFFIPAYRDQELSLSENIRAAITDPEERNAAWRQLNKRISYIFLGLPLVLLGLPILIIITHRWRHDLALAVPISCILAFLAWGWWSTGQSLLKAYDLNVLIVSWSIHFLTAVLGLAMLHRQNR